MILLRNDSMSLIGSIIIAGVAVAGLAVFFAVMAAKRRNAAKTVYCHKCGTQYGAGEAYCPNCGAVNKNR